MNPKIIADWRQVLRKAWSVKLTIAGSVISGLGFALMLWTPAEPSVWWFVLIFMVQVGAFWARFIPQPKMHEDEA